MSGEPTSSEQSKSPTTTDAVSALLAQLAGITAGLTALCLYIGWRQLTAYYSALGASWVVQILSPARLIQDGAGFTATTILFLLLSVYLLSAGVTNTKRLGNWSAAVGLLGSFSLLVSLLPSEHLSLTATRATSIIGLALINASVGMTVAELVSHLKDQSFRFNSQTIFLIHSLIFVGALLAPDQIGYTKARLHLAPDSTLPKITLEKASPRNEWMLVTTLDGSFLLMSESSDKKRIFKVVAVSDVASIHP